MLESDATHSIVESASPMYHARHDAARRRAGVDAATGFPEQLLNAVGRGPDDPSGLSSPVAAAMTSQSCDCRSIAAASASAARTSPLAGSQTRFRGVVTSRTDERAGWTAGWQDVQEPDARSRTAIDMLARLLHRYISIWLAGAGGAETVLDRLQDGATSSGWGPLAVGGIDAGGALSSGAGVVDDLDLDDVEWLHADVSGWRVTSKITNVSIDDDSLTIDHSMAGRWPTLNLNGDQIEGNPWVFVNRGGKWYAATYEWLRSGQVTKRITAGNIGSHTKKEPLESWAPQPGELVGFMVSTPARLGERTVNERSNVVLARWPG